MLHGISCSCKMIEMLPKALHSLCFCYENNRQFSKLIMFRILGIAETLALVIKGKVLLAINFCTSLVGAMCAEMIWV